MQATKKKKNKRIVNILYQSRAQQSSEFSCKVERTNETHYEMDDSIVFWLK